MSAKILIVDDSATDRLIIKNKLTEYNILTACDGLEAMDLIEEHKDIEIVLLDLNMPNMDGFEVLRALSSSKRYKSLRTIILTSYDEPDNEIEGLRMGAVDYIRKPIKIDSLKARIDVHLEYLHIQHLYEEKLYTQGLTFDTIFQQAPIGITISHNIEPNIYFEDDFYAVNPMFEKITGRTKKELVELGWSNITHPDDLKEDLKYFDKLQTGEINHYSIDKRYIRPDGSYIWANVVVAKLNLENDYKFNHICFIQDISMRKEIEKSLQESERSKSVLLSHLPGLAYRCYYDRDWTMQYVSAGCLNLTGYSSESLLYNRDLSFNDLIVPKYRELLSKEWEKILAKKLPFEYEYEIMTFQGERKWVLEMGQGIYDESGEVEALEGIILDISDRKEMENTLRYNSEHDTLTGLYNRRYLEDLLNRDANMATSIKRALIGINLTTINSLNLTYGFHYCQELIKKVALSLQKHCTEKCQLFYTYENRFVVYIKDYEDINKLSVYGEIIVETLESVLSSERIGAGIGIVEIDDENKSDPEQLLKNLLIASEKALSINDREFEICLFNIEMEEEIIREEEIKCEFAKIESDDNNGLFMLFQPILDIKTNKITDFEALVRINSQKLGLIMPLEFIPIAEKTKLIVSLGYKIFIKTFSFMQMLKENGYDSINVSINISIVQLLKDNFTENLLDLMNTMQINPANITLEITETIFVTDYSIINNILSKLVDFGIKIAIDDFGTGYSSLARERELNVNIIKIDKYFIDKILHFDIDESITEDIISMSHKLGHNVIAEGVEHETQRQYLIDKGCDKLQGYLIGRPVNEEKSIKLLRKQNDEAHL